MKHFFVRRYNSNLFKMCCIPLFKVSIQFSERLVYTCLLLNVWSLVHRWRKFFRRFTTVSHVTSIRLSLYPSIPLPTSVNHVSFVLFPREPLAIGTFHAGGRHTLSLGENEETNKGSHARSTPQNN